MTYICYDDTDFQDRTLATIQRARQIIQEYQDDGYRLTLRQLYYQFVARDYIPNEQREYNRLGRIVSDARLAGMISWEAIEDRTRNLQRLSHWDSPADIVEASARSFRLEKWRNQPTRVELWVEKEALASVFARVCNGLDVPFLCCRGYMSQSEMWASAMRLRDHVLKREQDLVILHFGDHDPSGIDMTRDIRDRLGMFLTGNAGHHAAELTVERVALNMEQVERFDPPPNPAKVTDSRWEGYVRDYGRQSWELDALEPSVLAGLVRDRVREIRDDDAWAEDQERENRGQRLLKRAADQWDDIADSLDASS